MNLQQHYDQMWMQASSLFESGNFECDAFLHTPTDRRRGVTLLARPPLPVATRIQQMLDELQSSEPRQYYYPTSDIHLTILSIISCYEGFTLDLISPQAYIEIITEALRNHPPFGINFEGITASPSCLMIQGFLNGNQLNQLRDDLRVCFKKSDLQHSIDKRYSLQTAHSTVVRFQIPPQQPLDWLEKIKKYRSYDFGTFEINELELVYNDWYQKAEHTVSLAKFSLGQMQNF
jgi:2'-5' RNA ligase